MFSGRGTSSIRRPYRAHRGISLNRRHIWHPGTSKTNGFLRRLAEAKPMAPPRANEAPGFPGRPVRDARSAEWERMTAWSLALAARGIVR